MELPLIPEDHGDLCLFESTAALERYVEPADIDECRVYDAESGLRFDDGPRWPEIDRIPARLKESLEDAWRGFVV